MTRHRSKIRKENVGFDWSRAISFMIRGEKVKIQLQVFCVYIRNIEMKEFQVNLPTFVSYLNFGARLSTVS